MPRKPKKSTNKNTNYQKIDSYKHNDQRPNIPTDELKNFMSDEDKKIETTLYPRDSSLDPQLVWQGKDEQDKQDLEVPAVPIYIQEKIAPKAIIEDFRQQVKNKEKQEEKTQQLSLFNTGFLELDFEQQIDFYNHDVNWANRMILGDSLLVMNSLAEKEGLKGKVQMIYLDPPYGIRFGSNWQVSTQKRDVKNGKADNVTRQPEQVKAFRDTWELGIHSYLSYLRDRLVIARELLTETGSVFVQIGDENVHLVRCLLDEVFGSENFFSLITLKKLSPLGTGGMANVTDYVVWYAKNKNIVKFRPIFLSKEPGRESRYNYVELQDMSRRKLTNEELNNIDKLPQDWKFFSSGGMLSAGYTPTCLYDFYFQGKEIKANSKGWSWKTNKTGMDRLIKADRLIMAGNLPYLVAYYEDNPIMTMNNIWTDSGSASTSYEKIYVVQTSTKQLQKCLLMSTDPGDLVIDPTMGSGTTAYVAEQWGRRWITIDTSRVALALARTRLMTAKYPYYLLADSPEGIEKKAEINGQIPPVNPETSNDIKKGFVYKTVPHITLKAIANNEEIDIIYEKYQEKLEPIRTKINQLLKQKWEEWEIPREAEEKWSAETKKLLIKWWELRQKRQQEIDESISRNSDSETLYDQPYEDKKRIRVTGSFTVESLSPHRILSTDIETPNSENIGKKQASDKFETTIIENLRKAGVQNTKKGEKLNFDNLEPYAGKWLQAEGQYTDSEGNIKRVAVSIGSEYGTVGTEEIKESAKEAVQGLGYDLLLVCGFAFEPNVTEESKRYGKLQVLITKMNPDLMLGDELLKKTGSGNLFMVFGEPDIEINHLEDGKITIELKGLDIYDPTTGEIRSSSPDKDIACWFIDTNYNGESFMVHHAYFTGAGDPYKKLKRTLKAEIDENAWSELYYSVSRPFIPPQGKNSKIAVKVINHYGDEVLQVLTLNL